MTKKKKKTNERRRVCFLRNQRRKCGRNSDEWEGDEEIRTE